MDRAFGYSDIETGISAILARPQQLDARAIDLRNNFAPHTDCLDEVRRLTPIAGRLEAFGAQGGVDAAGTERAATPWNYAQRPRSGRYRSGTAAGGWMMTPPEVQGYDLVSATVSGGIIDNYPPNGVTASDTYLLISPVTGFLAWGLPDIATGGVRHGYRSYATTKGDLGFDCVDSTGTPTRVMTLKADCTVDIPSSPLKWNFRTTTTTITAAPGDFILADASSGNVIVSIPQSAAANDGCEIAVQRIDDESSGNSVVVRAFAGDVFFGANLEGDVPATSFELEDEGESFTMAADFANTTWRVF